VYPAPRPERATEAVEPGGGGSSGEPSEPGTPSETDEPDRSDRPDLDLSDLSDLSELYEPELDSQPFPRRRLSIFGDRRARSPSGAAPTAPPSPERSRPAASAWPPARDEEADEELTGSDDESAVVRPKISARQASELAFTDQQPPGSRPSGGDFFFRSPRLSPAQD
jgi:hypothetical protein